MSLVTVTPDGAGIRRGDQASGLKKGWGGFQAWKAAGLPTRPAQSLG